MEDGRLYPRKWVEVTFLILFFGVIFGAFFYMIYEDVTVIDTRVETLDGKVYRCADADSYDNGMTHIRKPYEIIVPTKTIKIISKIK